VRTCKTTTDVMARYAWLLIDIFNKAGRHPDEKNVNVLYNDPVAMFSTVEDVTNCVVKTAVDTNL